jgi:hypothetical protein
MATTAIVSMTSDAMNAAIKMEPFALGACSVSTLVLIVPSLRLRPSICLEATVGRTLCRVGALRHLADVTSLTVASAAWAAARGVGGCAAKLPGVPARHVQLAARTAAIRLSAAGVVDCAGARSAA